MALDKRLTGGVALLTSTKTERADWRPILIIIVFMLKAVARKKRIIWVVH